jgi:alginate O-acetyltransferase complex protein AlgI
MVFSSLIFIFVYLSIVLPVYYICPKKFRNAFLFAASLVFYGYGEPVFILLMLVSVTMNYIFGILMGKYGEDRKKAKVLLVLNVVLNLGLLGFFKYAAFFVDTLKIIPLFSGLEAPEIPLPIGISFYTFQTMSYTIDVYKGNCKVQKNFVALGTYVALFPQLIAGPIVMYADVENQLMHRTENWDKFTRGVKLFMVGLAKKVLIANQMGNLWAELKPDTESGLIGAWIGIIAFTLQIYFDFSGYSDMARGLGNMLGFDFLKNFDFPYISKSITEFWRRWHMSLGTWFREYVYIPLGGNRCKPLRHVFNIMAVWFLTGMWHGASWNFILWGVYFGLILLVEKYFLLKRLEKLPAVISHVYALFLIILGWAIFDFTDITLMGQYIASMFSLENGLLSAEATPLVLGYLPLIAVGWFMSLPVARKVILKVFSVKGGWVLEAMACVVVLLLCVASLVSSSYNPFLYFRF